MARLKLEAIQNHYLSWFEKEAPLLDNEEIGQVAHRVQLSLESLRTLGRGAFGISLPVRSLQADRMASRPFPVMRCLAPYKAIESAVWGRVEDLEWLLTDPTTRRAATALQHHIEMHRE